MVFFFYVDVVFGGFVIFFVKVFGYEIFDFDFRFKGVKSIIIDFYKMGMVLILVGGIIFCEKKFLDSISVLVLYLVGGKIW